MIRLEMRICNTIFIEKLAKYQPYHKAKLKSLNMLQVKKYYHLISKITEQAKFTYSPLGKAFEKQIKSIQDQGQKKSKLYRA